MDFFSKHSDDEDESKKQEQQHRVDHDASKTHPASQHEHKTSSSGFLGRFTGQDESQHESPEVENKKYHQEAEHEKHSFLDKITGKAEREEEERRRREEEEERERERLRREEEANKGFLSKLVSHHSEEKVGHKSSEHHGRKNEDTEADKPSFFDKITGKAEREEEARRRLEEEEKNKGVFEKLGDKINTAAGGGREAEKKEDTLDKTIDFVQQHLMGQGPQDNESAIEQQKDEMIARAIRLGFKGTTGQVPGFLREKDEEHKKEKEEKEKKHGFF